MTRQHAVNGRGEASAKRHATLARKKAEEELEDREWANWIEQQSAVADSSVETLSRRLRDARDLRRKTTDLSNHLDGFYEEVDKLAKGKTLFEVTPLVMAEANQLIKDVKQVVAGDPFLDRVKEFVAAGNNPVYPDVVIALRTIRQSLARSAERLKDSEKDIDVRLTTARTIAAALHVYRESESNDLPTLGEVRQGLREIGVVDKSWFHRSLLGDEAGERQFDIDRLERVESLRELLEGTHA